MKYFYDEQARNNEICPLEIGLDDGFLYVGSDDIDNSFWLFNKKETEEIRDYLSKLIGDLEV